jgi:uncharacterized protein (TIGR02217 family)
LPLASYKIGAGIQDVADWETIKSFFYAMRGRLTGFRFKDWTDFKSSDVDGTPAWDDQAIGSGNGAHQLVKIYNASGNTFTRDITKPVSGTVLVGWGGSNKASGWSVDTTTGIVTVTGAGGSPAPAITAGYEYDVPCRFETDDLDATAKESDSAGTRAEIVLWEDIPIIETRILT